MSLDLLRNFLKYKKPTQENIRDAFNFLNENVFFGKCPSFDCVRIVPTLKDDVSEVYGQVKSSSKGWELHIDRGMHRDYATLMGTVAHEMIHRLQIHFLIPVVENDDLFKRYKKELKKVGIDV